MTTVMSGTEFRKGQPIIENLNYVRAWFSSLCNQIPKEISVESSQVFQLHQLLNPRGDICIRMFLTITINTPQEKIAAGVLPELERIHHETIHGNSSLNWDWSLEKTNSMRRTSMTDSIFVEWSRHVCDLNEELNPLWHNLIARAHSAGKAQDQWKLLQKIDPLDSLADYQNTETILKLYKDHIKAAKIKTYHAELADFKASLLRFFGLPATSNCW